MKSKALSGGAMVLALAATLVSSQIARAETPDLGIDVSQAQAIDDSNLGGMQGKFVPATGGQVVFFGMTLESSVQAANGTTETAGFSLGVNFKNGNPRAANIQTLTSQQTGTGTTPPPNGFSVTVPLNDLAGGIKQVVQVTGQDNQAANQASINLSTSAAGNGLLPNFPASSPCPGCSATFNKKGIDLSVDMPGTGTAEQEIGAGSILQAINLDSSGAVASNVLTLQMQTLPGGTASGIQGLSTVLQSLPVTFH
jgi:hypothetical protein